MSEFVEILSPKAKAELEQANAELVKMLSNMKAVNAVTIGAKTPSGSDSALKNLTVNMAKYDKLLADTQIKLERLAQAQNRTKITQNQLEKSTITLSNAKEKSVKQAEREAIALEKANNLYNIVQARVNKLTATYNNIAIKKELGLKLTDSEIGKLKSLESRLNMFQTALKNTDANIGKYQRNVGNYASGFDGLSNSINQITRELPAFTFSAQTGFLALSNNIPILVDEIQRLKVANQELIAQGKPVKSVFSQILASLLSFQTAMGVGILLFTVYGKEIGEFVSNLFQSKKALNDNEMQAKRYNQTMSEVNKNLSKIASEELSRSKILFETAKNTTLSYEQRVKAVDELQNRYPDYLGNLSKEQILAGDTAEAENKLAQALINRATAMAAIDMIEENVRKRLETQKTLALELAEVERVRLEQGKNRVKIVGDLEKETELNKERDEILRQTYATEALANIRFKEKNALLDEEEKILLNLFNQNSKYLDIVKQTNGENSKSIEVKRQKAEAITLENKETGNLLTKLREYIRLEKELLEVTSNPESRNNIKENIKTLEDALDNIENPLKRVHESAEKANEELAKLFTGNKDEVKESSKNWKEHWNEWSGVALDAINVVQEAQQQSYENELRRLELSRDNAILFAGESASAREEIDRQYDAKRREILKRQAKEQKAFAIVDSIINTARGVVSALAMTPPNVPLSIAIGVIGAAQTALIASQQIPQFYKGTDNAPEGWAWTDEKGAELHLDRFGRVKDFGSDKGARLKYLDKGDKIITATETEQIMFNNELNGILSNNKIGNAPSVVNNIDLGSVNARLDNLTNTIKNKSSITIIEDRRGKRIFEEKQRARKEIVSRTIRCKGYDV